MKKIKMFKEFHHDAFDLMIDSLEDIFDKWSIKYHTDEVFDDDHSPIHKFWAIIKNNSGDYTSNIYEVENPKEIFIYNILSEEKKDFEKDLLETTDLISARTGQNFVFTSEGIGGEDEDYSPEFYDYILSLR
jgi:hypothetical protein